MEMLVIALGKHRVEEEYSSIEEEEGQVEL